VNRPVAFDVSTGTSRTYICVVTGSERSEVRGAHARRRRRKYRGASRTRSRGQCAGTEVVEFAASRRFESATWSATTRGELRAVQVESDDSSGTLTIQRFRSRPSTRTAPSNFTYSSSPRSQASYTIDFFTCSSAQISATVSRRSSAIAAMVGGSGRSERVSPGSVDRLHSGASADKSGGVEGQGGARDSAGLPPFASACRSSERSCQGEGRRFEPGVPLQPQGPGR
jgi:hypothetical protein